MLWGTLTGVVDDILVLPFMDVILAPPCLTELIRYGP